MSLGDSENLVLTGFMGTGKSSVGQEDARRASGDVHAPMAEEERRLRELVLQVEGDVAGVGHPMAIVIQAGELSGGIHLRDLPEALAEAGAGCDDLPIYQTVCPQELPRLLVDKLDEGTVDWITVTR